MKDAEAGNQYAIKEVEKAPKLSSAARPYWTAFQELVSERGMGVIPRSKIKEYAEDELELDWRETEAFIYIIRTADVHSLRNAAEKRENQSK